MKRIILIGIMMLVGLFILLIQVNAKGVVLKEKEFKGKGLTTIHLKAITFDTHRDQPRLPVELKIDSYPQGVSGYYLVQFISPVKPQWKEKLRSLGAKIHHYIPNYAFIVKMNKETEDLVQNLDFVRWIGIYQPAYKISSLLLLPDRINIQAELENELDLRRNKEVEGFWEIKPDAQQKTNKDLVTVLTFKGANLTEVTEQIKGLGIKVFEVTDTAMGGVIKVEANTSEIRSIAKVNDVAWIEPWVQPRFLNDTARWVIQSGVQDDTPLHDIGIHGEGQIVTVADSGLRLDHEMFMDSSYTQPGSEHRKVLDYYVPEGATGSLADELGHGTHVSGIVAGDAGAWGTYDSASGTRGKHDGQAFAAKLIMQDIGPDKSGYVYAPSDYYNLFSPAYDAGSRIHTNSWGKSWYHELEYSIYSAMVDTFIWEHKDFQVLFAAGNDGPYAYSLDSQSEAKNVISVGATFNGENSHQIPVWSELDGSSRGFASDGRIKPTVMAPGDGLTPLSGIWSADYKRTNRYVRYAGTSMATPCVAGAGALIRQYYEEGWYPLGARNLNDAFIPSSALVRATLINGAVEINGEGSYLTRKAYPNSDQGWGRINLDNSLYFAGDAREMLAFDNTQGLATTQSWGVKLMVEDNTQPLEFTLAWTDYPGSPEVSLQLVNNLDLRVTDPEGNVYWGNNYVNYNLGYSVAGGRPDVVNVEESVLMLPEQNFPTGVYTVQVIAANVPNGETETNTQPFALVVTGGGLSSYLEDNVPISSVNFIESYWQNNNSFTLTANVMSEYEIKNVSLWYRYSDDKETWSNWQEFGKDSEKPWEWEFTALNGDGYYEFYSLAVDTQNNSEIPPPKADAQCGVDTLAPYRTIQAMIDAANSGDTIIVPEGIYEENVVIDKSLTLQSNKGAVSTLVQTPYPYENVFTITADNVNISGFTVEGTTSKKASGIRLEGADYCNISNIIVSNNCTGIKLYNSTHNTLTQNTLSNNTYGMWLENSSNNTITDNTANSNSRYGILLYPESSLNTLTNNNTDSSYYGISVWNSDNNFLDRNHCDSNYLPGIIVYDSDYNTLTNNITTNSKNWDGINMWYSDFNTLDTNTTKSNHFSGIFLAIAENNMLTTNTAESNGLDRFMGGDGITLASSNNNTLESNIVSANTMDGISLRESNTNTLTDNNISKNGIGGIDLIYRAKYNTITNNTVWKNWEGISLYGGSKKNTVNNNIVVDNDAGIWIESSSKNTLYNNYLSNNNNLHEDDSSNTWNIDPISGTNIVGGPYLGGNYWSSYSGEDTNGDGLGDTSLPYHQWDYHPLIASSFTISDVYFEPKRFKLSAGETTTFYFELSQPAEEVKIELKNKETGENLIFKLEHLAQGKNSWVWHGTYDNIPFSEGGVIVQVGKYKATIKATSYSNEKTMAKTTVIVKE